MARLYGLRPSDLLRGDLVALNIDVAMGMELMKELDAEFAEATSSAGMGTDIARCVRTAVNLSR